MVRSSLQKWVVGAAVAAISWSLGAPQADAFWHRRGGSCGSSGGGSSGGSSGGNYGSCGGSSGSWGSSGGSSGSWGSSGGYRVRVSYNSCGGSSGSWGSSGGSSGSWGSSGGSWGGSYGSQRTVTVRDVPADAAVTAPAQGGAAPMGTNPMETPAPMTPGTDATPGAIPAPGAPANPAAPGPLDPPGGAGAIPGGTTMFNPAVRSAVLNVRVPVEAKIFVNGRQTTSTGNERRFVSNGLKPGFGYTYELRAEMDRDGRTVTETKEIKLQAGQSANVNFSFSNEEGSPEKVAKESLRTSVTLHVPADAKVFLGGNESKSTGPVREFSTTKLANGQSWDNYTIRVELDRNGQKLSKVETLSLKAGEARDVSIDFDASQVAAVDSNSAR